MSANHTLAFPTAASFEAVPKNDAQMWVADDEHMLPVRQVIWASLAFIVLGFAVLLAA